MKKKKFIKKAFNNIKTINYSLFMILFYFNAFFYLLFELFQEYKIFFLAWNMLFVIIFYTTNKLHSKELDLEKNSIKKLIDSDSIEANETLNKEFLYEDHNAIYRLFKRLYIKKNIVEKDYNDLKNNFQKLVPENFLDDIWKWVSENINIWMSIEKKLHIMFIDISGFTKISEKLTPSKTLFLLNIYFDWIVEIVKKNWWYVDKFLWDWLMLIFETEFSDNVLKSAVEIRKFVEQINVWKMVQEITVWIWINSWKAILGTIGSKERMDITIIWDSVNIAARLENITRSKKEWIIFSEETFKLLQKKKDFNINNIGKTPIRGRNSRINIYWIIEE